jgi:hypothetical protein
VVFVGLIKVRKVTNIQNEEYKKMYQAFEASPLHSLDAFHLQMEDHNMCTCIFVACLY